MFWPVACPGLIPFLPIQLPTGDASLAAMKYITYTHTSAVGSIPSSRPMRLNTSYFHIILVEEFKELFISRVGPYAHKAIWSWITRLSSLGSSIVASSQLILKSTQSEMHDLNQIQHSMLNLPDALEVYLVHDSSESLHPYPPSHYFNRLTTLYHTNLLTQFLDTQAQMAPRPPKGRNAFVNKRTPAGPCEDCGQLGHGKSTWDKDKALISLDWLRNRYIHSQLCGAEDPHPTQKANWTIE